ncbi:MAG: nickel pincer cofactor biosynthesis protein LarB [Actinobacteria bacterium]|nr:nickel pincer cofactor biosynthesis protein LarB [Actinomycetota bacterium]
MTSSDREVRTILEGVASGALGVEDALAKLPLLQVNQLGEFARLDFGRAARKGVPEVVYAPGKTDEALLDIVRSFLTVIGLALVSRLTPEGAATLSDGLSAAPGSEAELLYSPVTRVFEAWTAAYRRPVDNGVVGILTGGTSDVGVAEEAALVAAHMGCRVLRAYDVGVAGVHRLFEPLSEMIRERASVLVVVAGMEGALPSLVSGLVDVPVIGVPKSGGYGLGGDGSAALYSMLQSCSPGLVTVNVDNGVGAGATAGLIARRVADAGRSEEGSAP